MSVTTAIILDKRRMNKKTKNYPVCIRVTFERKPRVFPTGIEMTPSTSTSCHLPVWVKSCAKLRKIWKRKSSGPKLLSKILTISLSGLLASSLALSGPRKRQKQPKQVVQAEIGYNKASQSAAGVPHCVFPHQFC